MSIGPAPLIPVRPPAVMTPLSRLWAIGIALGCLGVLGVAAWLTPSANGVGTHEGLGRPACGFLEQTGIPCLSCGMTTSYAWFVRGNLVASLYLQPAGLVLAAATAVGVWAGLYIGLTGRPIHRALFRRAPAAWWVVGVMGFLVLAWGWKIFIHTRGWDGWP